MKTLYVVLLAVALTFSTGCWPKKKKAVVIPPPPAPVAQPAPIAQPAPPTPTPAPAKETPPPSAVLPKPHPPRPVTQPPVTPVVPAPQLGAMIPAAQRQQLDAAYTADLRKARSVLAVLGSTPLGSSRMEMATRVRSFIRQAEEFHPRDLAAAADLAQRARVLAEDLERRSK